MLWATAQSMDVNEQGLRNLKYNLPRKIGRVWQDGSGAKPSERMTHQLDFGW